MNEYTSLFEILSKTLTLNKARLTCLCCLIHLFDLSCIDYITADREFIGGKWWDYLVAHKIPFYIRFRDNFDITLKGGKVIKGHWILRSQKLNTPYFHTSIVTINNTHVYFSGMKYYEKGELKFLMIASYNKIDQSFEMYKNRWQIETMFRAFKSSGFNLEDTHLIHYDRINKLLYITALSFIWSYNMGIYLHQNTKAIRILKHGRRAKSFFKYGLEYISNELLKKDTIDYNFVVSRFLSCT